MSSLTSWLGAAFDYLSQPVGESSESPSELRAAKSEAAEEKAAQQIDSPNKVIIRWIAKTGAALVSGLGLAGVVTLIGAAVLWERFDHAGLPAAQALDAVPDSQLTTEGASLLITTIMLGLLAVAFLFGVDRSGQITKGSAWAMGLIYAGAMAWTISKTDLELLTVVGLGALGLVFIAVSVGVARVTGKLFVPFALAFFFSAVFWSGALNFAIANQQEYVQPAAVLRSPDGLGIRGLYVADDDDAVYVGVIRTGFIPEDPGDPVPLYRIPKDDETRVLIGKLRPFDEAVDLTEVLRQQLKETAKTDDPLPGPPELTPGAQRPSSH